MNTGLLTDAQIMQLPDHCFGERFVCATYFNEDTAGYYPDISPIVLPVKSVLWAIDLWIGNTGTSLNYVRLALGDHLPATEILFLDEQPLIEDLGDVAPTLRGIFIPTTEHQLSMKMKQLIEPGEKRFLTMLKNSTSGITMLQISAVFSAIPTRVPDWMVSI